MGIPDWSVITLSTELVVTTCVFTIIWRAYTTGYFMKWFALAVLSYELIFNVSYMASREAHAASNLALDPYTTGLAIFHGVFSLLMFAALIAFFTVAWRKYRTGMNFFAVHRKLTYVFIGAWTLSILSGISLFIDLYLH